MALISINHQNNQPLVEQVVEGVQQLVDERVLRLGTRLPSIRQFADQHRVSRFTVVQAYDRLVAAGYLQSRKGSGFYVNKPIPQHGVIDSGCDLDRAVDTLCPMLRRSMQEREFDHMPGCGWLPSGWLDHSGLQRGLRTLSRSPARPLVEYGSAAGYLPLRQDLQQRLAELEIGAQMNQIITTHGVSHGLDLLVRYFVRPGDVVLVEDPAYFNLFGMLKLAGATLVGVPRRHDGPDLEVLEQLLEQHRPKLFITTTVLHNPTGSCISQAVAYRLLQLAEKHDLMIIEDDVYGDLHGGHATRLAALDQLNRVVYVNSFSKTISASLRVGYIACHPDLAFELIGVKLLTGLTTTDASEQLVHQVLTEGHYRKAMVRLQGRLESAREKVIVDLERLGMRLFAEPEYGMFLWAELPDSSPLTAAELNDKAWQQQIILAPGNIFSAQQRDSNWLRFNAAYSERPGLFDQLHTLIETG